MVFGLFLYLTSENFLGETIYSFNELIFEESLKRLKAFRTEVGIRRTNKIRSGGYPENSHASTSYPTSSLTVKSLKIEHKVR